MTNSGALIDLQYTSPMEIVEVTEQTAALKTREDMEPLAIQAMRELSCETLIPGHASEKEYWDAIGAVITEVRLDIDSVCVGYIRAVRRRGLSACAVALFPRQAERDGQHPRRA